MASESSCWRKLTELVTYHILSNINRNELITIMDSNCMSYKIRRYH